ncbi:MAG: sigma-70 family RNA polymerase sigma factor [Oscillospiraceae bacterium]|nr:sigma-70 family RNA polymerase sigma factor [Clostridia bacterium]MBP3699846.1 sigma-70 family RNA polymerase sigma factor [Oscillospiraceae bacterium]
MIKRNEGFTEQEKLQNRFTAFIMTSMSRARIDYLRKEKSRTQYTYEMEDEKMALIPDGTDFMAKLCDSDALVYGLKQLDDRERFVILARVLEEKSFDEIADKLGLKYKGVAAVYYRAIAKLRNILGGN